MVTYVDAVFGVTMMRVCMLREYEGVSVTEMLVLGMEEVWLW